jgi:hypothetical protein
MPKKYNLFARFMFDYKTKEEAKGRVMDMTTVTIEAGKIWEVRNQNILEILYKQKNFQKLTEDEKQKLFKTSSKAEKPKKDCRGDVIEAASACEAVHQNPSANHDAVSELLISCCQNTGLECTKFYFISVNYFLKRDGVYVWPCELALSEFSIKDGINRTMHMVSSFNWNFKIYKT